MIELNEGALEVAAQHAAFPERGEWTDEMGEETREVYRRVARAAVTAYFVAVQGGEDVEKEEK